MERSPIQQPMDRCVETLLHALITDGAHHKQHDIERALRILCTDEWVDKAKQRFQWESGIPA